MGKLVQLELSAFDGEVNDPQGERGSVASAVDTGKSKRKYTRRAKRGAPTEAPPTGAPPAEGVTTPTPTLEDARRAREMEARGYLETASGIQRAAVMGLYGDHLPSATLVPLCERMKFTEAELTAAAPPLAEGLEELNIKAPWYARLAMVLVGSGFLARQVEVAKELQREVKDRAPGEQVVDSLSPANAQWNAEKNRWERRGAA